MEWTRQGACQDGQGKWSRMHFWNDPLYKPKNVICDDFWIEFMRAAFILRFLHHNTRPVRSKYQTDSGFAHARKRWLDNEPDVYAVFNKLRQDFHDELPYRASIIQAIDEKVEKDYQKELEDDRRSRTSLSQLPARVGGNS